MPADHNETDPRTDDGSNLLRRTRDLKGELENGAAGEVGTPVDARCTGCKQVRLKRATADVVGEDAASSFKHICHTCKRATWWNVLNVLDGIVDELEDDQDDAREGSA